MDPICRLVWATINGQEEEYNKIIGKLGLNLTQKELEEREKKLMKVVLRKWLPAADCLIEMMVEHLPSPIEAQKYRTSYLYEGEEEEVRRSMETCDPKGPLVIYISKMVGVENRFAAFGRIFSGTVVAGQKVKIIGPNYKEGSKTDYFEKSINSTMIMIGDKAEFISDVPCGNTVALMGIDQYLVKTGTITSLETKCNNSIKPMKYSVSPVFRVAVKPAQANDLPKLIEAIRKLVNADALVQWTTEETGENIIAGCGELHMEICVHELRRYAGREIIVSEPVVSYRETVLESTTEPELVKSNNKKNRFWGRVEPLHKDLVEMIENKEISEKDDPKERSKVLVDQFGWEKEDTYKIWAFGPEGESNILVDQVKGVQYVHEAKDSICSAFQWASREGGLAGENMRGVRFNLTDANIHADPAHRKAGQILPAARRLFHGLELCARPTLLEPMFLCEITTPNDAIGGIYQTLNQRRGMIIEENQLEGALSIVKAYLPVAESYGFSGDLRGKTQGKAFPQCVFSHWEKISGVPYEDEKATKLVLEIRKRKGLKEELPEFKDFLDKL